jgi:tetratricopeptide (TPR) repeat protein
MSAQELEETLNRHLEFLAQDPDNLHLLLKITTLYQNSRAFESAQTYLDKAKELDREACLGYQGLLHMDLEQIPQAKACFIEALNLGESPFIRYHLAICYLLAQELEKSRLSLLPLMEHDPNPDTLLLMARILHKQKALDAALLQLQELLKTHPQHADALGLLALLHLDLNQDNKAKEIAQEALLIDANVYDAQLVLVLIGLIKNETTTEEIEALLRRNPKDSRLWFALGSIYLVKGEIDLAERALKKSVAIYAEFYDAYIALAWCQLIKDDLDEAEECYNTATQIVSDVADAWGGLALVYALKGEIWKAEPYIFKANELNPDCFLSELASAIAYCSKDPVKARDYLTGALGKSPLPISRQLALLMDEMEHSRALH